MGAKGRDTEYLQSGRKPPLLKHKPLQVRYEDHF